MTIKSDKWIKKMAVDHGMIEPFQEDQIRYSEDNLKLISYGLSSYGYDVRCATEFKVFKLLRKTRKMARNCPNIKQNRRRNGDLICIRGGRYLSFLEILFYRVKKEDATFYFLF